ncbi:MAG: diaminopimelate epimerase [Flavobacteriaceae bacterium]|nr:diaminopimelate epimerase [Flavobacteriaceae bacterium]
MNIDFFKYQGAGNDFIMIDHRNKSYGLNLQQIKFQCDRRFGIGGDGLILLQNSSHYDFKMVYYNSDGNESSMCGNGGRCIVSFAYQLGIIQENCQFEAIDGAHQAIVMPKDQIKLQMQNVSHIISTEDQFFLDTGSPHHISFVDDVKQVNVNEEGSKIRNSSLYGKAGSNVNFINCKTDTIQIRTYERGVEAETLACGTGVTAAALAAHHQGYINKTSIPVQAVGGDLKVDFKWNDLEQTYEDIWLTGPAKFVFQGKIAC